MFQSDALLTVWFEAKLIFEIDLLRLDETGSKDERKLNESQTKVERKIENEPSLADGKTEVAPLEPSLQRA